MSLVRLVSLVALFTVPLAHAAPTSSRGEELPLWAQRATGKAPGRSDALLAVGSGAGEVAALVDAFCSLAWAAKVKVRKAQKDGGPTQGITVVFGEVRVREVDVATDAGEVKACEVTAPAFKARLARRHVEEFEDEVTSVKTEPAGADQAALVAAAEKAGLELSFHLAPDKTFAGVLVTAKAFEDALKTAAPPPR